MDEVKFEQYVQMITDKVYHKLLEKESGKPAAEHKTGRSADEDPKAEGCGAELIYSKKLLSETDARDILAMGACRILCEKGTIITALAEELLDKKGVKLVRK